MFDFPGRFQIVRNLFERSPQPEAVERAFDEWCIDRFDAYTSLVAAAALLVSAVLGMFDLGEIPELPGLGPAYGHTRIVFGAFSLIYFLLPRPAFVRRHLQLVYGFLTSIAIYFCISAFSSLGGPGLPFIHLWYSIPLWTVALPMRFGSRVGLNLLWGASLVASVLVPHPEYWASPWAAQYVQHLGAHVVLSIALGQFVQILYRKTFLQMQGLARQGDILEAAVLERTGEIKQLVAHLENTQEAERIRISRDLHDEVGQELAALRHAVAFTHTRFNQEPAAIAPNLAELEELVVRTTTAVRGIVSDLRPPILDDLGFAAAAKWLAERIARRTSLTCEVEVVGPDERIDEVHRTAAFRILQEALTNVMKHSEARHAKVLIAIDSSSLTISVTDDGKGLPVRTPPALGARSLGGMGLLGMRERASSLGGTLVVANREAGGVEVSCRLPLGLSAA